MITTALCSTCVVALSETIPPFSFTSCPECGARYQVGETYQRNPAPAVALGALARTLEMWTGRAVQIEPDRSSGGASKDCDSCGQCDACDADRRRSRDMRTAASIALPCVESMLTRGERDEVLALWWMYVHRGSALRTGDAAADAEWVGYVTAPSHVRLLSWCKARGKIATAGARRHGERMIEAAHDAWDRASQHRSSTVRRPWLREIPDEVHRRVAVVYELRRGGTLKSARAA